MGIYHLKLPYILKNPTYCCLLLFPKPMRFFMLGFEITWQTQHLHDLDAIFQNHAQNVIFCYYASDGHYDSSYVQGYLTHHVIHMDFCRRIRD